MRKDNKKPNFKKDEHTVAIVKQLYFMDIPPTLIAVLYGIRQSTVSMWGTGTRRASVEPVSPKVAKMDMSKRFQAIIDIKEAA